MDNIKKVIVDLRCPSDNSNSNTDTEKNKIPKKRVITGTNKWSFSMEDLVSTKQQSYIEQLYTKKPIDIDACKIIHQHIQQKISGYRSQDIKNGIFDKELFVDLDKTLTLLHECKLNCYYCHRIVNVLYENVREPSQWSLERIDNSEGHNQSNLMIACLECNLRRKTMHHERYAFTKQLKIVRK